MIMERRGQWRNWYEFLFSAIGCVVGLVNIWRFPYLCYRHGGGAFLVPYLIFMFLFAIPLFFLEMSYAQFSNLGPGRAWICIPLLRGLGYGMVILTGIVALYYIVFMSWSLYYLAMSFSRTLPWSHCDNTWNTPACYNIVNNAINTRNYTAYYVPITNATNYVFVDHLIKRTSSEEFWELNVLEITEGVEHPGFIRWQLLLCLLAAWFLVFLCLIKGIKSSGIVMYVTATVPFIILTVLLVLGMTLEGAKEGFLFYAVPRWDKLLSLSVWNNAALQVFYSTSIGMGGISTLASYNNIHNNIERDAILLPTLNCLTSWFAGCVISLYLGNIAHTAGLAIENVVHQGPGLAFIVYPEALSHLPLPQIWSVLFFVMLFMVGLNGQVVHVQTLTSAIVDSFPKQLSRHRVLVTAGACVVLFLLGIPCITQGGIHFIEILDWYASSVSLMFLTWLEFFGLVLIYGIGRLYADIELMLGRRLPTIWGIFLRYITPEIIILIWGYNVHEMRYWSMPYPAWAIAIGWVVAFLPIIPLPIFMVKIMLQFDGTIIQRIRRSIVPDQEWCPADEDLKEEYGRMTYEFELSPMMTYEFELSPMMTYEFELSPRNNVQLQNCITTPLRPNENTFQQ